MSSLREYLIKKLGGFTSLEDALESTDEHDVLTLAVQDLFNAVGPEDIFQKENGEYTFEGKILPKVRSDQLMSDAFNFSNGSLWRVLKAELRWQANKMMFYESKSETDLIGGKIMHLLIRTINSKLQLMVQESHSKRGKGDVLKG